jgi:hypothetical protein
MISVIPSEREGPLTRSWITLTSLCVPRPNMRSLAVFAARDDKP